MTTQPKTRKRLLINSAIQLGYWKVTLIGMLLPTLLLFAAFYQFMDAVVIENKTLSFEEMRLVLNLFTKTSIFLMISFPIATAALLGWSLIISNKVAGPLYRMEIDLEEIIANNDWSRRIHLRKGDQHQGLADKINHVLGKVHLSKT